MAATAPAVAPPEPTALPRTLPTRPGAGLDAHLERLGPLPRVGPGLVDQVQAAGLRGRGGAGFPTGTKLRAVAAGRRRPVVVANGTEGEPASAKDRTLLVNAPHLVLDGITAATQALGADRAVLCVDRVQRPVLDAVHRALDERRRLGTDPVRIELLAAPNRYVAGEETALVRFVDGHDAKPTFVPPRPFEKGVGGRPTLVDNVETLAQIGLIARFGGDWYRAVGTADEPGTLLVTLSGAVAQAGVREVPSGTGLAATLVGAGVDPDRIGAVLVGGYFGAWLDRPTAWSSALSHASLRSAGGALGCGVVFVHPVDRCGLAETASIARWLAGENAGQCGPCMYGLPAIADALDHLALGTRHAAAAVGRLEQLLPAVEGRGACRHPDGAVRLVRSALATFAADVEAHASGRPCPAQQPWLPTPEPGAWR